MTRHDQLEAVRLARLQELLARLAKQGYTQQTVASRTGVPSSYISDIKARRRGLSELYARRLGEEFDEDYEWILGISDVPNAQRVAARGALLALVDALIEGPVQRSACWDGSFVEVSAAIQQRAAQAQDPYLLKISHADRTGRLRVGDLVLISQAVNAAAEIQVVKQSQRLLLARPIADRRWQAVNPQIKLTGQIETIGHCVGIVWGQL